MRAIIALLVCVATLQAFDPLEYIKQEHDKMFFGVGGGYFTGFTGDYYTQFPDYSLRTVILQAGVGDYPFAADIRYCVEWAYGYPPALVSGTGAKLTVYEVIPCLRTYLFWKHKRIKSYFLAGIVGAQEQLISTTPAGKDEFRNTDGISYGFQAGLGLDVFPVEYSFFNLEVLYKFVRSDLFVEKELFAVNLVYNIGR
jgi:hypothetical protein